VQRRYEPVQQDEPIVDGLLHLLEAVSVEVLCGRRAVQPRRVKCGKVTLVARRDQVRQAVPAAWPSAYRSRPDRDCPASWSSAGGVAVATV